MLSPNGSLVTPIEQRVSPSAPWMLAQHYNGSHGALVVQLRLLDHMDSGLVGARYKPLQLLLGRLTAPLGTIHCRAAGPMIWFCPLIPAIGEGFSRCCAGSLYYREQQHEADVVTAEAEGVLSISR